MYSKALYANSFKKSHSENMQLSQSWSLYVF